MKPEDMIQYWHWLDFKNRHCKCEICKKFNKMSDKWTL